jgi:signal transduction histidine kinase
MPPRPPSLQRQLINWLLVPLLIIWLFGCAMSYFIAVRYADLANDRSLFGSTLTLASQVKSSGGTIAVDQPDTALKMISIDPYDKVYFKVSDHAHGIIAGRRELPPPPVQDALPDMPYYHDGMIDGKHVRIASMFRQVRNGKDSALVLIQVAETLVKRKLLASEILAGVVLPQLLLISLALVIVWYGIRRGLSPLQRIQEEVKSRSHLDLSPLREENAPREIGALINALNSLLGRLQRAISVQSRFIADAAHQLRTPLAGIKTQTDFALRQTDPELVRHSLRQLQISSGRVIRLVNQLLSLARAEPGGEIPRKHVDLVTLAGNVTRDWVPQALKKGVDLGFEAETAAAPLMGSDLLLREMLNNLIDNAIRYTPAGGEITVRVRNSGGQLVLTVEDNGPGIPHEERELVFERFHRAAASHEEGCGLGLPIVREIAHAHHGEIRLLDSAAGSLFEVRIPAMSGA